MMVAGMKGFKAQAEAIERLQRMGIDAIARTKNGKKWVSENLVVVPRSKFMAELGRSRSKMKKLKLL